MRSAVRIAPWRLLVVVLTAVLVVLALLAAAVSLSVPAHDQTRAAQLVYLSDPVWFGVTGGFLVLRRPANVIGWVLWEIGFVITSESVCEAWLNRAAAGRSVPSALLGWCAWLDGWSWVLIFAPLVTLLLRFPDGRVSGSRWRRLELLTWGMALAAMVVLMAAPQNRDYPGVPIPLRLGPLSDLPPAAEWVTTGVAFLTAVVAFVAAAIGQLNRYRRSHGLERAQRKWLLFAAGVLAGTLATASVIDVVSGGRQHLPAVVQPVYDLLGQVGAPVVPVAVAVAVMRYGLYEIDRIVSRTVSYAVVVAVLAGAYAAVVTAVSALVPDRYGSIPVVLATLAISALFVPVRRRVVRVVDHRFNRSRYDAAQVVSAFAELVRGRAGQGTTGEELVSATRQVLQPAHASVWLAPKGSS